MTTITTTPTAKWWNDKYVWLIAFICIALYANTFRHGYSFDDIYNTPLNEKVSQGVSGMYDIFTTPYISDSTLVRRGEYRPIPMASFALEYSLFGKMPQLSHIFNVLFYLFGCLLLYAVWRRVLWQSAPLLAALATLVFAAHPMHTEVVASLKNREELLSFLFGVAAGWLALRYLNKKQSLLIIAAAICYALAFLCKSSSIIFGIIIPLWLYYAQPKMRLLQAAALAMPLLLLSIGAWYAINTAFAEGYDMTMLPIENPLTGKSFVERLPMAFYTMAYYFKMAILPYPMLFYYGLGKINLVGWGNPVVLISAIAHIGMGVYALWQLPKRPLWAIGALCYLTAVGLYSNLFFIMPGIVADRYLFNALIGGGLIVALLIYKIIRISPDANPFPTAKLPYLYGLAALFLLPCIYLTISRNRDWATTLSLLSRDIKHLDQAPVPQYLYAKALQAEISQAKAPEINRKNAEKAVTHYGKAMQLYGGNYDAAINSAAIYCNLLQNPQKGLELIQKTLAEKPNFTKAYLPAGDCYKIMGNSEKARYNYEQHLASAPTDLTTASKIVQIYLANNQADKAAAELEKMAAIDSTALPYYLSTGMYHLFQRDTLQATVSFEKAIAQAPPSAASLARIVATYYKQRGNTEKFNYYNQLAQKGGK